MGVLARGARKLLYEAASAPSWASHRTHGEEGVKLTTRIMAALCVS